MKHFRLAIVSFAALAVTQVHAQPIPEPFLPMYDTITSFQAELIPSYYSGVGNDLQGDIFTQAAGTINHVDIIKVAYVSTDPDGGTYYVTASVWNGAFDTLAGSVTGRYVIPPLQNPSIPEVHILTLPRVHINLEIQRPFHAVSFKTFTRGLEVGRQGFYPQIVNRAAFAGTDYPGIAIDVNQNGILEPNLPIPNQEWFSTPGKRTNLACALYWSDWEG